MCIDGSGKREHPVRDEKSRGTKNLTSTLSSEKKSSTSNQDSPLGIRLRGVGRGGVVLGNIDHYRAQQAA